MPTFSTTEPIAVRTSLNSVAGNVQLIASERADTTVDVRPVDSSNKHDVRVAEQTRVDYADGRLTVVGPRRGPLLGRGGAIDVTIELPSGSRLDGETGMGDLCTTGRLGECRFRTSLGGIRVEHAGDVVLSSALGDVSVDRADGSADVTTSSGAVRLGHVAGRAVVRSSLGECRIGEAAGDLRVTSAHGRITVDRAHADVTAKTPIGAITVGDVARGKVVLETSVGRVDVGVREGSVAWLDVKTTAGRFHNELGSAAGPEGTDETVEVRVRTSTGDILVHRA